MRSIKHIRFKSAQRFFFQTAICNELKKYSDFEKRRKRAREYFAQIYFLYDAL